MRIAVTPDPLSDNYALRAVTPGTQELTAIFRNKAIILDPEADVPFRYINTGLDSKTITRLKFLVSRTDVMNVHSKIMGRIVPVVAFYILICKIIGY